MDMRGILCCVAALLFCGLCSAGPAGKEFALSFMQNYIKDNKNGPPRFMVEVSSPPHTRLSTKVKVSALGKVYEKTVQPGKGVTFQMPDEVEMIGSTRHNHTILVEADQEVLVSSFNYIPFSADTSVIYPVKDWGTEYYIFTAKDSPADAFKEFSITSHRGHNSVVVHLKGAVLFEGSHHPIGSKLVIELKPFESVQIQSKEDLTGSRVVSQQPVAVSTGNSCAWKFTKCNHVYEQLLPVSSWGKDFIIAPIAYQHNSERYDTLHIMASQPTKVIVSHSGNILPVEMEAGGTSEFRVYWPESFHITADKGIQVLFEFNGAPIQTGLMYNPFLMTILPTERFSTSYTLEGQADFINLVIMVARTKDKDEITLDGTRIPNFLQWIEVAGTEYSWAEIPYGTGAGFHHVVHPHSAFGLYSIGVSNRNGYGSQASGNPADCSSVTCQKDEECQMKGGAPTCIKKTPPAKMGTCWVMGDPHYRTFDGHYYNFNGNCTYTMAKNCHVDKDHPAFEVEASNEKHGTEVTFVGTVIIKVYGHTITMVRSEVGLVRLNDLLWNLPISLNNGKVKLWASGLSVIMETDFGLTVQYDWEQYLVLTVPGSYMGKVCGLCGNFNGKQEDDLTTPGGSLAGSVVALGNSWRVPSSAGDAYCRDECTGGKCGACESGSSWAGTFFCDVLTQIMDGPFSGCNSIINSKIYHENCMYDVCMGKEINTVLCNILQAYTQACQRAGVRGHAWRSIAGCPDPKCPANSHFEYCGSTCPATCEDPSPPSNCKTPCVEACTCDEGYLRSGNKCVHKAQCGCRYNGRYLQAEESIWGDDMCSIQCTCNPTNGKVECKQTGCPYGKECRVVKGIRDCYSASYATCKISGDPHYVTFDNHNYDFQGTCTYTVAQGCHLEGTRLHPFSVVVENEKWYAVSKNPKVSVAKLVAVEVYGQILVLRKNQVGMIMVNGVLTNLPLNLNNRQVQAYQEGHHDVILTDFGLKVTYDLVYHVTITVPGNYHGKTCGLCGNYTGNGNDEFQLPDGKVTKDLKAFGAAWKVSVPGVVCDDGCSGDVCPKCDEKKKKVFQADCSIIINPKGPFAACHSVINPTSYFRDCVYDVCMGDGDRNMLCHSIAAYVSDCQDFGTDIKAWRTPTFCPLSCRAHSHYQICAETCDTPCPGLTDIITCPTSCAEGCACDSGYFFNGTGCIRADECSCYNDGRTYEIGETVITDDCHERYTCLPTGVVKREHIKCEISEVCKVKKGVRGCYPRECLMEAGGSFTFFNGRGGVITTMGAYEIITVCDGAVVAEWFRVVAELQECGSNGLKSVVSMYVFFEDMVIAVNSKDEIWVNGKRVTLPRMVRNEISVSVSDKTVIIEKRSGLRVSYSLSQEISITVSDQMADKVCGACGKFTDDITLESVQNGSIQVYMDPWRAADFPNC